jgi:hypothetical protein
MIWHEDTFSTSGGGWMSTANDPRTGRRENQVTILNVSIFGGEESAQKQSLTQFPVRSVIIANGKT